MFVGWWLHGVVPLVAMALVTRSVWGIVALGAAARVVRAAPTMEVPAPEELPDAPNLLVLLPMLREQAVAADTVHAFTNLSYPAGKAVVCVITTEREELAKVTAREQVVGLTG